MKINEKNLCSFANSPNSVDLEGFLNKKGEVNKNYQKRWFVLKGNLLFYFERKGDKEPIGVIILEGCTVELAQDSEQYCFQIIFHGQNNRTYFLSAESQETQERWLKALTCAGYEYMKLMVTELQRQLNEIEGNRDNSPKEQPVAPKPPPRRQNPFNRPAPLPPTQSIIKDSTTIKSPSTSTVLPENLIDVTMEQHQTTGIQSGTSSIMQSTQSTGTITTATNISAPLLLSSILTINTNNDDNLFKIIHEEMGKPIIKEMSERRIRNENKVEPLIIL